MWRNPTPIKCLSCTKFQPNHRPIPITNMNSRVVMYGCNIVVIFRFRSTAQWTIFTHVRIAVFVSYPLLLKSESAAIFFSEISSREFSRFNFPYRRSEHRHTQQRSAVPGENPAPWVPGNVRQVQDERSQRMERIMGLSPLVLSQFTGHHM